MRLRVIASLGILLLSTSVTASEYERRSLAGLTGAKVLVERLYAKDADTIGLSDESIQTAVELRLRQYGVPVLSDAEQHATRAKPVLYVHVETSRPDGKPVTFYTVELELTQWVTLANGTLQPGAATWDAGFVGHVGDHLDPAGTIRETVIELVDQFVNDFLAANPHVTPPKPKSQEPRP